MRRFFDFTLFWFVIELFNIISVNGQLSSLIHEQLRFNYLNVDNGLTNNRARALAQDQYGFIWIGTRKGISRFNGYQIDQFINYIDNADTLSFRETRAVYCDSNNILWVGGSYGVCYFNWNDNFFYKFIHPKIVEDFNYCGGIDQDKQGNLWFSTNLGLIRYNKKNNTVKIIEQKDNIPGYLPSGRLQKLLVDSRNNVWYCFDKNGIGYYNQSTGKVKHFLSSDDKKSVAGNRAERMYEDTEGNIWIGDYNNGASKYSYKTGNFKRYYPQPGLKESGRVRGIQEDSKGNFWFGTQAGLYLFDKTNETFYRYAYAEHPISTLSHNSIQDILIDNQEGLWLGTHAGGVSYTNLNVSGFVKYGSSNIPSDYFLNDKNVYSVAFDNKNNIWVGTENGGLNYLDRKSGRFTYFKYDPENINSPRSNNIKDIRIDKNNNIWFGTYKGGLNFYNTSTGLFKNFAKSERNPGGLEDETVYSLYFDIIDPDLLWVGTIEGLYMMDIKNELFTKVNSNLKSFQNIPELDGRIYTIQSNNENILIGGDKFSVLNRNSNTFRTYKVINDVEVLNVDFIISDINDIIWFGINSDKIVRFDLHNNQFRVFGPEQGLPAYEYLEAEDDKYGNIWVSTSKGIIKLENIIESPDNFIIRTYDNSDNLQSLEFLYHSKAESDKGEILFGGINGFNSFKPENVKLNPYKPNVIITKLVVANKEVGVGEEVYGQKLLSNALFETKNLKFNYKIKTFTFHFTAFHFVAPENNRFAYILEGFDDHWNYTDANVRFASYSNIKKGNYVFKVKASNNNGIWMDNPVAINIKVTPPFWKTYWFYSIIIVVISFLVYLFIKWREEQLKRDKQILEEQLVKGKKEIDESKEQVRQQSEELRRRDLAEREQKWHNEGIINIGDIINQNKDDIDALSKQFLVALLDYLKVQQGVIYVLNDEDINDKHLELLKGYGLSKKKLKQKRIEIGENLVGVCFKDVQTMQVENIPDDYTEIKTGIGNSTPLNIILVPLRQDEMTLGVLEIAALVKMEPYKIKFIETISAMFTLNLYSSKTSQRMNELLHKTQQQTEELHAQEEEMRQNMEEMLATQDESSRREQELEKMIKEKDQLIEELKNKNEIN